MDILHDFKRICEENDLTYFGFAGTGIGALRHKGFIPWDDDIDVALPRKDYDTFLRLVKEQMNDKYYILNTDTDINYPLATTRLVKRGTRFREFPMKDVDCNWGIFLDIYALDNLADGKISYYYHAWTTWFWGKLLILRSIKRPVLYFGGVRAKIAYFICAIVHDLMKIFKVSKKWLYKHQKRCMTKYNNRDTKRIGYYCDPSPFWNTFYKDEIYPLIELDFEDLKMPFPKNIDAILTNMYGNYMTMPPVEKRRTHFPYELDFGEED